MSLPDPIGVPICSEADGKPLQGALVCGVLVGLLGVAGMLAWIVELGPDSGFAAYEVRVNPATGIALILAGCAIVLAAAREARAARAFACMVGMIAAAKLIDLTFGGVPIDASLFADHLERVAVRPSRMAPNTALTLLVAGAGLALSQARLLAAQIAAQVLAAWVFLGAMLALVGHVFGVVYFRQVADYLPMAPATAVGLLGVSVAIFSLTREVALTAILRDPGPAGTMFRLTLPLIVVVPVLAGSLRIWSQRQGYFSDEGGIALQVVSNVLVTSGVLIVGALALYRSDMRRRQGERALRESEQFNRLVASANPDCIALLDDDEMLLFVNEALLRVHGLTDISQAVGRRHGTRLSSEGQIERAGAMRDARETGVGRFAMRYDHLADGVPRWFDTIITRLPVDPGSPFRFLVSSRDITEKREIEDQLRYQASHDELTGLSNRSQFQIDLDRQIRTSGQDGFAVLTLDIDNFKMVNDTLGHDAGDVMLQDVARRLSRAMRHQDIVARFAGDEFAVIAHGVRTEAGAIAVAERIFQSLREPWLLEGQFSECRMSIGASLAPRHGDTIETLLKHADIALYEAKARGRGRVTVFRPSMKAAIEKRSRQIELGRQALAHDLIVPYYQPKVALATGRVAGFEALLRWRHATQGVQMPHTIEAAFEDVEIAGEITRRMLDHVLLDMRRWVDRGVDFGHVAVNVTAADLRQPDFAANLLDRLAAHGLPPACLQVEITETVFMGRGAEYVQRALGLLHDAGIRVALDDFGTGYACLSHLKQFPVDIVKIDRSFLHDFARNSQNQAIINTIISLGHSLDIAIVAEGVETREQERHLLAKGCTFGQGYHYGKAMPALRVPRLLQRPGGLTRAAA